MTQIDLYDDRSLNKSPKKNWVERVGGLPPNVRARARAIKRKNPGWPLSRCIATAINANKHATRTGGDLFFKGRQQEGKGPLARHVGATAHWEAMKGKAKLRKKKRGVNMASPVKKAPPGKKKGTKADVGSDKKKLKQMIKDFKGDKKGKTAARLKSSQQRLGMKVGLSENIFTDPDTVDLAKKVFFKNRRTPEIVSDGAKPKKGGAGTKAGPVVKSKPVTAEDKKKMKGGKWLREDKSGKKPGDSGYLSGPSKGPDANKKKKKKSVKLSSLISPTILLSEGERTSTGGNPLADTVALAEVGVTVARKAGFNPNKYRRGFGGKFAAKGTVKTSPANIESSVNSLQVGESIELAGGKGWIKRLDRGFQVVAGDGSYNKVLKDQSEALSQARKITLNRIAPKPGGRVKKIYDRNSNSLRSNPG